MLEALDRKTFCTLVPDPFVSREDLLKMLLIDFGVMSVDDLRSARLQGASRPELSYPLYEFLKSLVPLQAYAVLIIDEAQNLSPQVLEEIRILADLEAPEKLLQLVLVGQPELRAKLKDHAMRQVDQRVSVRVELLPLDRAGVGEYIAHRLNIAGAGTDRVTFSDDAVDAIFKATKGNPRLINLACDKGLHHGHLARTFTIGPEIVSRAVSELGMADLTLVPVSASTPLTTSTPLLASPPPSAAAPPMPSVSETDDFGLSDKFFERPRSAPEDSVTLDDAPGPQLLLGGDTDTPSSRRRRTLLWLFVCVVAPALVALLIWAWQDQSPLGGVLPEPPSPPANEVQPQTAPAVSRGQSVAADSPNQPFEVGVALFAGYERANRLAVVLAASGFRAITRPIESSGGRMYEVRTGPYFSRDAAEADAAVIRKLPGYSDARVVTQSSTPSVPAAETPSVPGTPAPPAAAPTPASPPQARPATSTEPSPDAP